MAKANYRNGPEIGTVCFYKDTCGTAVKHLVVSSEDKMNRKVYTLKNLYTLGRYSNECGHIIVDRTCQVIVIHFWSDHELDFDSLQCFAETCQVEKDPRVITIKMIALFGVIYSKYLIKEISGLVYGQRYKVKICKAGTMSLSRLDTHSYTRYQ
ncbi:Hypothetical predicted protein [Paramuricea clavata]|uniref:Uncharacterized protein n=1 Tax=Paramuricea clavata TaxID=317549 RepID=A0A7D9D6I5_PARCT|nr:Hypothetical predicted protein [Paramuricea clavata]